MRKILRPILFIIGIALVAFLGGLLVAAIVGLTVGMPAINFIYPHSPGTVALAIANAFFIIGIPLTMLIFAIMRVFMGSNFKPRWQFGLWAFWFINVIGAFAIGSFTVSQFSHSSSPVEMGKAPISLSSDTLFVEMERSPAREAIIQFGDNTCISDGELLNGHIHFNFLRSESGRFEVEQVTESRGKSIQEAGQLASQISYNYKVEGDRLIFLSHFVIPKGTKWRGQVVDINIYVPDGKYVRRDWRSARLTRHVEKDPQNRFSHWHSEYLWRMTPAGMIAPEEMKRAEKLFDYTDFSRIRVEGNIKLHLRQGDDFKIKMTDGERHIDDIEIRKNGDRLTLRSKHDHGPRMAFEITLPTLDELWLIRSRDMEIRDFDLEKLRIVNEGRGDLEIFADIDSLHVELSNDGDMDIRGKGTFLKGFVTDNARLEANFFEVENAVMEIRSNGRANLSVSETLRSNVEEESRRLKVRGGATRLGLNEKVEEEENTEEDGTEETEGEAEEGQNE